MINLNVKMSQSSANKKQNPTVNMNIEIGQVSSQPIEDPLNKKLILQDCYPQGSVQNGQFIVQPESRKPKLTQNFQPAQSQVFTNIVSSHEAEVKPSNDQRENLQPKQKTQPSFKHTLKHNRYLKVIFDHFCNISYADTKKKTFEEMQKRNQTMSLNRFMLFCKEFNIYSIFRFLLKTQNLLNASIVADKSSYLSGSKINTIQKKIDKPIQKGSSHHDNTQVKNKMLEIPVKEVLKFEKKMITLYRQKTQKNEQMSYENFVRAILSIYEVFCRFIIDIYPSINISNELQMRSTFISKVLFIKDAAEHRQKMNNLKIQFKGSISYHHESTRQSEKYLKKPLVMHGGRSSEEMKKQLQIYQGTKVKKTESWINTQPQMIGIYSKSRVFYKPNPSKIYQTNDVIRLARHEAGRTKTESLFDYSQMQQTQKKLSYHRKQSVITFSKVFEDKTNTFSEKLDKLKEAYGKKDASIKMKKTIDKDDEILNMYFQNEKKTYGDEVVTFVNNH